MCPHVRSVWSLSIDRHRVERNNNSAGWCGLIMSGDETLSKRVARGVHTRAEGKNAGGHVGMHRERFGSVSKGEHIAPNANVVLVKLFSWCTSRSRCMLTTCPQKEHGLLCMRHTRQLVRWHPFPANTYVR